VSDERRQFQRLTLSAPVDGWFGDFAVRLVNISASGALCQSDDAIPLAARALLRFYWRGAEVEVLAETARSSDGQTALAFLDESDVLRTLLADSAREILKAQEANAGGDRAANIVGDETLTSASARPHTGSFITWILGEDGWKAQRSLLPDQPPNGFTVSAGEPDEQIELLCRTYESGDVHARNLTRLLAELSVLGGKT
jgi:hypothetical protein